MAATKIVLCCPTSFQGALIELFILPSLGDGTPHFHFWYGDLLYRLYAYERDTLACWLTPTDLIPDGRIMIAEQ